MDYCCLRGGGERRQLGPLLGADRLVRVEFGTILRDAADLGFGDSLSCLFSVGVSFFSCFFFFYFSSFLRIYPR